MNNLPGPENNNKKKANPTSPDTSINVSHQIENKFSVEKRETVSPHPKTTTGHTLLNLNLMISTAAVAGGKNELLEGMRTY